MFYFPKGTTGQPLCFATLDVNLAFGGSRHDPMRSCTEVIRSNEKPSASMRQQLVHPCQPWNLTPHISCQGRSYLWQFCVVTLPSPCVAQLCRAMRLCGSAKAEQGTGSLPISFVTFWLIGTVHIEHRKLLYSESDHWAIQLNTTCTHQQQLSRSRPQPYL